MKKISFITALFLMISFLAVGYAQMTTNLQLFGKVEGEGQPYDVYISSCSPHASAGVSVTSCVSTVFSAEISSGGRATFVITVKNVSDKVYVYERLIEGAEINLEGVYNGTDVRCTVDGLVSLQELAPSSELTFALALDVPTGVTTDQFMLKFNFIEKTGIEILPDTPNPEKPTDPEASEEPTEPEAPVDPDASEEPTEKPTEPPQDTDLHGNFWGLVQALLSTNNNCLNDSSVIYDAIYESLTSNKRPESDAPILHCLVNSISGGTMTEVTENANALLTAELQFIFEADATNRDRLFLYMYYRSDCTEDAIGTDILVYKQVVSRGADGVWFADGTYIGHATVGYFYGGGKNGKDVLTVNPYSWRAGTLMSAE